MNLQGGDLWVEGPEGRRRGLLLTVQRRELDLDGRAGESKSAPVRKGRAQVSTGEMWRKAEGWEQKVLDHQVMEPLPSVPLQFPERTRNPLSDAVTGMLVDTDTGSPFPARVKGDAQTQTGPSGGSDTQSHLPSPGVAAGDLRGVHCHRERWLGQMLGSPFLWRVCRQTPVVRLRDAMECDRSSGAATGVAGPLRRNRTMGWT